MSKCKSFWKNSSKKRKIIVVAVAAAIIVLILGSIIWIRKRSRGNMPNAEVSVQEATAATGDISDTIVGTGNLEADASESITIPSGIIIEEVKVESGDSVSEGDVLAVVDQASVLSAMESVQEEIEELDSEINSSKSSTQTETITSKVSGRVKEIYVEADDSVEDAMLENGALMLLSIDGTMAVELEDVSDVTEGDTVTVILSDDTEEEGTVEEIDGDTCIVTFSDESAEIGETVKVKTEEGESLGRGDAYIHQKLEITATGGTVSKVSVSKNTKVYSGTTLLTLENDGGSLEYQQLTAERAKLAESLKKLISMSKTGTITADQDGIIGEVNVSAESSGSSGSSSAQTGAMSYNEDSKVQDTAEASTSQAEGTVSASTGNGGYTLMAMSSSVKKVGTSSTEAAQSTEKINQSGTENTEGNQEKLQFQITGSGTSSKSTLVVEAPQTGNTPQTKITTSDGSYTGTVTWNPADSTFAAGTSYQADVTLYATDAYVFETSSISRVQTGLVSGITVSSDGKTLTFRLTFSATESTEQTDDTKNGQTTGNTQNSDENSGNNGEEKTGASNTQSGTSNSKTSASQATGKSGGSSSAASSGSSSQGTSSTSSSTEDSSESSEITAFTLASNESMLLVVSVDELDINSVAKDQEAEVTLDAIEGETFTGTVTKVGNTASSASGGVAKYSVEITIPKHEQMKNGMNASATIVIEKKENIVTIPVNAHQEKGNKVFVYTKKDSDGNLSGEQEVTTGLSDGDMVEITEGLSAGDVVYYQKTGSTSGQSMGGMSGGGEFPEGGEMPGGGEMPSGGDFQKGDRSSGGMGGSGGGRQ